LVNRNLERRDANTPADRVRRRRRRAYVISLCLGLLFAVLAPVMRDAWNNAPTIAAGSGLTAMAGVWLLMRFQFEPLYRKIEDREATLRKQSDRQEFGARLSRALERSRTEPDVLKVAMRAVETVDEALPTEALIADSSRAHLRRHALSDGDEQSHLGCQVVSPWDCPAMSTSQFHHFPDSSELDACPFLTSRADAVGIPLTAVCLPMASRGQAVGVLHSVRPADQPIDDDTKQLLLTVASRTGVTIGSTRAFAKSQLQASTDPLTGLLNRRSLEERAATVLAGATRYSLIMADLDSFKTLNDLHGHSTGDRALRRFAEVLRSVTHSDSNAASSASDVVVARVGGEEFVILMPLAPAAEATALAERIRTQLRIRDGGSEPSFTVSLGVAEGSHVEDLNDVFAAADRALFAAKAAGRDRVIVAGKDGAIPLPRASATGSGR
jgi:diguanylate cyclase (GGDEF)-like protein